MATIFALPGSLRQGSFNAALARACVEVAPAGTTVTVGSLRGVPLYDGDAEAQHGIPAEVAALKDAIASADGLLLVTPEYNQSLPGVFKNAIDWCSRPSKDMARVFGDKPTGIIGASAGPGGTRLGQTAWLPVLRGLGVAPFLGKQLYVADAGKLFDAQGVLTDATTRERLAAYLAAFAKAIA